MSDEDTTRSGLAQLLTGAEALVRDAPPPLDKAVVAQVVGLLQEIERATPGGASLHAQLDRVARWVTLLSEKADHERFGGSARVRDHVLTQFRLARAAADDYVRAMG